MSSDKALDRGMKNELEAICESVDDDYADEVNELDTLQLCEWFESKAQEELGITLKPVGVSLELSLNNMF